MKVMKFGGTSLASWARFSQAADLIAAATTGETVAAVLSAPATVTNSLLEMIDQALKGADHQTVYQRLESLFRKLFADAAACGLTSQQQSTLETRLQYFLKFWNKIIKVSLALSAILDLWVVVQHFVASILFDILFLLSVTY